MSTSPTNLLRSPLQLGVTNVADGPWVLDVSGSPNGVLAAPRGTLALREDVAQVWQNLNGATSWTLLGAGGSAVYPDNVFLTWGNGTGANGGNVNAGVTDGPRRFLFGGDSYSGPGGVVDGIELIFASGSMTVTDASVGPNSGPLSFSSGDTDCELLGGTGGNTGDYTAGSGSAFSFAGSSGNTGRAWLFSGNSATGNSGVAKLSSGSAGLNAGDVEVSAGAGGTTCGDVRISAQTDGSKTGVIYLSGTVVSPSGASSNTGADAQTGVPLQAKQLDLGLAATLLIPVRKGGTGSADLMFVDMMFYKTGAVGVAGDTVAIRKQGSPDWVLLDLNGVTGGTALRIGSAGVTTSPTANKVQSGFNVEVQVVRAGIGDLGILTYMFFN